MRSCGKPGVCGSSALQNSVSWTGHWPPHRDHGLSEILAGQGPHLATQTPNLQLPVPVDSWAFRDVAIRRFSVAFVCLSWCTGSLAACGPSPCTSRPHSAPLANTCCAAGTPCRLTTTSAPARWRCSVTTWCWPSWVRIPPPPSPYPGSFSQRPWEGPGI